MTKHDLKCAPFFAKKGTTSESELHQDNSEMNVIFVHSRLDDYGLPAPAFRVYCHLARRAGRASAWPAVENIARVCRLNPQTVRKNLRLLTAHRLLSAEFRQGATTLYRLTAPSAWRPPTRLAGEPAETDSPLSVSEGRPAKASQGQPSEMDIAKGIPVEGNQRKEVPPLSPSEGDAESLLSLWNSFPQLLRADAITNNRARQLRTRLADPDWRARWRAGIDRLAGSSFASGGGPSGWKADLDWFLRADSLVKILEGKYDNRAKPERQLSPLDLKSQIKALDEVIANHAANYDSTSWRQDATREQKQELRICQSKREELVRQLAGLGQKAEPNAASGE